tara:strand:- start:298 stop:456 length:159 start_codon:yes stop_codon:yes gene_type:complete
MDVLIFFLLVPMGIWFAKEDIVEFLLFFGFIWFLYYVGTGNHLVVDAMIKEF